MKLNTNKRVSSFIVSLIVFFYRELKQNKNNKCIQKCSRVLAKEQKRINSFYSNSKLTWKNQKKNL